MCNFLKLVMIYDLLTKKLMFSYLAEGVISGLIYDKVLLIFK